MTESRCSSSLETPYPPTSLREPRNRRRGVSPWRTGQHQHVILPNSSTKTLRFSTPLSGMCLARQSAEDLAEFRIYFRMFSACFSGQWAGSVWGSSGPPGQEQSCAQMTNVGDCVSYVLANGAAFDEACKYRYQIIIQSSLIFTFRSL